MVKRKHCQICQRSRPLRAFPLSPTCKDGRGSYCQQCMNNAEALRWTRQMANVDERAKRIPGYAQAAARGEPLPYADGPYTAASLLEDSEGIPEVQGAEHGVSAY